MGRKKGGGGRSYNTPVMYEPSTMVHGTSIGTQTIDAGSNNLTVTATSSASAGMDVGGGIPQIIKCEDTEQIEQWLAVLRDFLAQFEQQGTAFCQTHRLDEDQAAQLMQAIIGLLAAERGQMNISELSAVYLCVQQILLTTKTLIGVTGS